MLKKILKITGISILVVLVLMAVLPFAFKGKIVKLIKEEANKNLNATLNFSDVSLSFFRSFPHLNISIDQLSLVGQNEFKGDTLISAGSLSISTDLMSIIRGNEIGIRSVEIKDAGVLLKILKNGKANWDITKPEPPSGKPEEPSTFKARLKHYSIQNSRIVYDDRESNMLVKMAGLNHVGSGDFTADMTNLETETKVESFSYIYEDIAYLNKVKMGYKAGFKLDLKNSLYEFLENTLSINDLHLKFSGSVTMPTDDIRMDIKYEAMKNDVKNFFSLVPGAYTDNFSDVKSSGKLAFNGFVKGIYNEKSIPGFAFNLMIENGMIQYPALPGAITGLQVKTAITNPGGDVDKTLIDVSKFHAVLAGAPIDARLIVRTPVSDPDIDASLKGRIDLSKVKDFMPLEKNTRIAGIIDANVQFRGRLSSIEQGRYQQFQASGRAALSQFQYADPAFPQEVRISNAQMDFTPKAINLSQFRMTLGKSDISANGHLENYLAYVFSNKPVSGSLTLTSNLLDLNPFMAEKPKEAEQAPSSNEDAYIRIPANIGFRVQANIGTLLYDNMRMTQVKGALFMDNQVLKMNDLALNTLGGSIMTSGTYDTKEESGPAIDFSLQIKDINIREAAKTFNTVKTLAPIAENTSGTASVKMNFASKADKEFNLIYPTLNGSGNISTSTLSIEGFEMAKQAAAALKIDKLKKWQLEKFSAGFTIRQGKLFIEPFDTKIGNYKAKIGGSNGLDQSINYVINLEIPRSEFGGAANSVLNNLTAQANAKGFKGELKDIIPVTLNVTGTFKEPKIKTDLRSQTNDVMDDLKKQAAEKLKEEADRKKKEIEDRARAEKDRLMQEAEKEKERLRQEADRVKKEAEERLNKEKEKAKKKAEEEAKKQLNKLLKKP